VNEELVAAVLDLNKNIATVEEGLYKVEVS